MSPTLRESTLPNGMKLFCLYENDARVVYETFDRYFEYGIELREGDTVFDLGANIGVLTLLAYARCKENVTVYAFEPIPDTFEVLRQNIQRYDPEKLKAFPTGVSNTGETTIFTHYPMATLFSSAYPDQWCQLKRVLSLAARMANPT